MTTTIAPPVEPKKKRSHRRRATVATQIQAIVRLDFDTAPGFELAQRRATALALASAVPEIFRGPLGSVGHANTMLALELAHRLNFPVLMVMQNLSIIKGRPGWSGQFYIALAQSSGRYKDHRWEWRGTEGSDARGARMIATRLSDGVACEGRWVDIKLAKAEGWWSNVDRSGIERSKWQTMPDQMLVYRSAAFWARQWDPGATIGIPPAEELEDIPVEPAPRLIAPPPPSAAPPPETAPSPASAATLPVEPMPVTDRSPVADAPLPDALQNVADLLGEGKFKDAMRAIGKLPLDQQRIAGRLYNEAYDRQHAGAP